MSDQRERLSDGESQLENEATMKSSRRMRRGKKEREKVRKINEWSRARVKCYPDEWKERSNGNEVQRDVRM